MFLQKIVLALLTVYPVHEAAARLCFQINAKVVSFDETTAVLQSYDGSRVTLALDKLPEETRKFLKANIGHPVSDCFPDKARISSSPAPKSKSKK